MVTLQSRWKQRRSWNLRALILPCVAVMLCAALAFGVKGLIVWMKDEVLPVLPAAMPRTVASPSEPDLSSQYTGKELSESERQYNVLGYTFILPNDFVHDVLPQPKDVPVGGRFTGIRYRASWDDASWDEAAQIRIMVVDYPKDRDHRDQDNGDEEELDDESKNGEALDRLFERLSRNSGIANLTRGETKFGELDGLPIARCSFSGDFRNRHRAARTRQSGVALATTEKNRDVFFFALWDKTADPEDREFLESSVFSLRRAGSAQKGSTGEIPAGDTATGTRTGDLSTGD